MHKQFMLAALEQARLGRGVCAPNPCVGAVAVHNNKIVASAWHQGVGTAHAELSTLQLVPAGIRGVTLYVTLEPCNHWGKTPPCVSAIINAGVSSVVYAYRDPNPVVAANDTPRILSEQGIDVLHLPLREINEFYRSYQYWTQTKKPWVTAKIAQTLDGKIAGVNGQKIQLSNDLCTKFTHKQRLYTDVILTTAKTIQNDSPSLNVRLENINKSKPVAIIDTRLSLSDDAKIFTSASHCHVYHDGNIPVKKRRVNCSYHAVTAIDGRLDLTVVINHLGLLGFHNIWVEAGGHLFSSLHEQGLVQTTYLYIVPVILGNDAVSAYHGINFFNRPHTILWQTQADNMIACLEWQENECLPD